MEVACDHFRGQFGGQLCHYSSRSGSVGVEVNDREE